VIYFDTFPDTAGLDPVAECTTNIAAVEAMQAVVAKLKGHAGLAAAIARQDSPKSQAIVQAALFNRPLPD
jgi:xylose isomerase